MSDKLLSDNSKAFIIAYLMDFSDDFMLGRYCPIDEVSIFDFGKKITVIEID